MYKGANGEVKVKSTAELIQGATTYVSWQQKTLSRFATGKAPSR
jgi:hypothetical protein